MPRKIEVTDHALIRWLERRHGIDMEFFRGELADELQHIVGSGAYSWRTADCTYVFRGDTLVSVLAAGHDDERRRRQTIRQRVGRVA